MLVLGPPSRCGDQPQSTPLAFSSAGQPQVFFKPLFDILSADGLYYVGTQVAH